MSDHRVRLAAYLLLVAAVVAACLIFAGQVDKLNQTNTRLCRAAAAINAAAATPNPITAGLPAEIASARSEANRLKAERAARVDEILNDIGC